MTAEEFQKKPVIGCLVLTLAGLVVGGTMCARFVGYDHEAEKAKLQALANEKRRAWLKEAKAAAHVSIDKVTRNYKTGFVYIDYTITNAGNRTFCHLRTAVSTRGYKDQSYWGKMNFNKCLAPGASAKAEGYVRGYSVVRHSFDDLTYRDDCRRTANWNNLRSNRECAVTHGSQFHGPVAY